MTALLLFLACFVLVFALGVQQLNVSANLHAAAAATSLVISTTQWVLIKWVSTPTTALEFAAYTLGSAAGIVAAMRAHPAMVRAWGRRRYGRPTS